MKNIQAKISQGKILLIPFDTVWGLAGDAQNRGVVEKVFAIKRRSLGKPISVLLPNLDYFGTNNLSDIYQAKEGSYTWLIRLRQRPNLSPLCYKKQASRQAQGQGGYIVGVRHISSKYQVQKICSSLNIPLTATSANLAGEQPVTNLVQAKNFYDKLPEKFKSEVVLVKTGEKILGKPSKIINLDTGQEIDRTIT
jgi:L-threonylcarbamoyladenylate synthase